MREICHVCGSEYGEATDEEYFQAIVKQTLEETTEPVYVGSDEEGDYVIGYCGCESDYGETGPYEEDEPRFIDNDNENEEETDDEEGFD